MTTNTGGPAFPYSALQPNGPTMYADSEGMTLRDYFAAKAMQSLITIQFQTKQAAAAETAYEWADAMLSARSTEKAREQ